MVNIINTAENQRCGRNRTSAGFLTKINQYTDACVISFLLYSLPYCKDFTDVTYFSFITFFFFLRYFESNLTHLNPFIDI